MSKLRSDPEVDEFVDLCKLVIRTNPDTVEKISRIKGLNWQHLRMIYNPAANVLTVRGLDQDRQYATVHYTYRDEPGRFEYDLRTIRYALPLLRAATVLDRLANL